VGISIYTKVRFSQKEQYDNWGKRQIMALKVYVEGHPWAQIRFELNQLHKNWALGMSLINLNQNQTF